LFILMPLQPGDKLGPYEIIAPIGKGGMGEVYRAHDSRLNRDVAIKVSNAQFTERFTREARAIAAVNHTNICHLYDVGPNCLVRAGIRSRSGVLEASARVHARHAWGVIPRRERAWKFRPSAFLSSSPARK
jgi:hypothetical protein